MRTLRHSSASYRLKGVPLNNVIRARDGDSPAFEALVYEFAPSIYRVASAIAGEQFAPDIVQETFVSAWRELRRLREPERFAAWLHRIAVNRSRSVLRSRRSVKEIALDDAGDIPAKGDFRKDAESRTLLAPALLRLSPDHKVVIALHYAAGMSISEVAGVLQIPAGTVKSRLNAALADLRNSLSEELK